MTTVLLCALLTLGCLAVFYVWGRSFLKLIRARTDIGECVCFGFVVMHVIYHAFYLPFFLARGSFRALSMVWMIVFSLITVFCLVFNARTARGCKRHDTARMSLGLVLLALMVFAIILWLCVLVGAHPRPYTDDAYYIGLMDNMVYHDYIMLIDGALDFHHGFNSFYALFSTVSLFTGIRPFYIALFTLRFIGVVLTAIVAYCTGKVFFDRRQRGVSGWALALSVLVPVAMMLWDSIYAGHFFYLRTNESKAYCMLFLLPLAFSVCAEYLFESAERGMLWKKQLIIGLAAMPIASSSMMTYPFLVAMGTAAILAHDRFQGWRVAILRAAMCIAPNIGYMALYLLL